MEITAGVGAFSKAALPDISIDGQAIPISADGTAHKPMKASSALGKHSVNVTIKYKDQEGKDQVMTKRIDYEVGQSAASIALDKMNVLYIGVDNPVTISATGGGAEKVNATITGVNGSLINKGGGAYIARVNNVTDECWINVSVEGRPAGRSKFRVRTVPQAQAYVGGAISGSNMTAGAFKAQAGVGAGIKDFPFELKYEVVSFTFTCDTDDGDIVSVNGTGNAFSGPVRSAIDRNVKANKLVTIENIRVKGPDGRTSVAPSLFYNIK
jgi:gliding motility-associated protein GldM